MGPKVLLLDMDGVMLHQPNLHRFVEMRVASFVRRRLEPVIREINYPQAESINRSLYATYGHTLLGLNRIFGMDVSIHEFNAQVYDKTTLDYIQSFQDDAHMNRRMNEVRQLLERCHIHRVPVYIFSNAPMCWSRSIVGMMGVHIDDKHILGSDHPLFDRNGRLKPEVSLYHDVARLIEYRHSSDHKLIFVDDSLMNLRPCIGEQRWHPVLLNPNMPPADVHGMAIRSNILDTIELL